MFRAPAQRSSIPHSDRPGEYYGTAYLRVSWVWAAEPSDHRLRATEPDAGCTVRQRYQAFFAQPSWLPSQEVDSPRPPSSWRGLVSFVLECSGVGIEAVRLDDRASRQHEALQA